ncbi:tetratricopeptide repeat protein [Siphonobacter aquaeclarae]|uniref:Tetratricopeptide repeat-containing protein n=1 Tax=Siphonobacter aquaeclarae TaxID=563176 RepID=A0A1G9RM39_9BACT|nr:tetratricopeptide repeat protein [Siphonobacter aquaeclarae]SDM24264.1 Tetratricopeptide repeat-containing protein [Siphonobacter aquaeclarae]
MKKLVLPAFLVGLLSASAYGQNSAIMALESGKLDKAKEEIDKAVQDPKSSTKAKTWFVKGQVYEGLATDPKLSSLDSMSSLGAYEAYKKAIEMDTKEGKLGSTAKDAQKAITKDKEAKDKLRLYYGLVGQGNAKYQNKNFADALKLLKTAMVIEPGDTTAAMFTGIVAQQQGDNASAKEGFTKYLELGGKDPVIFYTLSNIYRGEKNDAEAIKILDKGIASNPDSKDLKNEKINIYLQSGRTEDAIKDLKALVDKDPSNAQNLVNLGILYDNAAQTTREELSKYETEARKAGDSGKAVKAAEEDVKLFGDEVTRLTAALKKKPTDKELKRQLTDVTTKLADAKKKLASASQEKATADQANASKLAESQKKVAELTAKWENEKNQAKANYEKVLAIDGNNYDANYQMGVFFFNEGVVQKGKVDAMDMNTYNKEGKAIEEQVIAKFKQALPFFEKAWSVRKEEDLKTNLAQTYNILKQLEKSTAYDEKISALN